MTGAVLLAAFLVLGSVVMLAATTWHLGRHDRRELRNSETD